MHWLVLLCLMMMLSVIGHAYCSGFTRSRGSRGHKYGLVKTLSSLYSHPTGTPLDPHPMKKEHEYANFTFKLLKENGRAKERCL